MELNTYAEENGIKIVGLEDMPELALSDIYFDNPWDKADDNLYQAEK